MVKTYRNLPPPQRSTHLEVTCSKMVHPRLHFLDPSFSSIPLHVRPAGNLAWAAARGPLVKTLTPGFSPSSLPLRARRRHPSLLAASGGRRSATEQPVSSSPRCCTLCDVVEAMSAGGQRRWQCALLCCSRMSSQAQRYPLTWFFPSLFSYVIDYWCRVQQTCKCFFP